jgi:hypothetical protein
VVGRGKLVLKVRVEGLKMGVDLLNSACHIDGRAASSDLHLPFDVDDVVTWDDGLAGFGLENSLVCMGMDTTMGDKGNGEIPEGQRERG